ncbi:Hypothetical predicted protein [Octopus vulgaris]|uniref:Uncharacterized protein n=1 Tax=Octopus vulgaris TaxID=6645 RepID=A0AA36AG51_OCTVU|nr:Hypothetical predicted protein [Octopus vulgaris]
MILCRIQRPSTGPSLDSANSAIGHLKWRAGGDEEYDDMDEDEIQHVDGESNNDNNVLKKDKRYDVEDEKMLINIWF